MLPDYPRAYQIIRKAALGMALSDDEWYVLPTLIACRIAMSLCIGAYSSAKDPTNEYLLLYAKSGWNSLSLVRSLDADAFDSAITPAVD